MQSPEWRPGPGSRSSWGCGDTLGPPGCFGYPICVTWTWKTMCSTARSEIWVLKGDARARMIPANLEHLHVEWRRRGSCETAWVTPGHDCLCSYSYGHEAAVRPKTKDAIWDGIIGLWSSVALLLSPWCARGNVPTGVNLNRYSGSRSCIPGHSDNESLFGPLNSAELFVSLSLSNSVEFKVRRRAPGWGFPLRFGSCRGWSGPIGV